MYALYYLAYHITSIKWRGRCKKCGSFRNWRYTIDSKTNLHTELTKIYVGSKCKKCGNIESGIEIYYCDKQGDVVIAPPLR